MSYLPKQNIIVLGKKQNDFNRRSEFVIDSCSMNQDVNFLNAIDFGSKSKWKAGFDVAYS